MAKPAASKKSPIRASTATVDVKPVSISTIQMADPATAAAEIQPKVTQIAAKVMLFKPSAPTYEQDATNALIEVKGIEKALKEKLESITVPLNVALKNARSLFKPALDKCEAVESQLRQGIIAYRQLAFKFAEEKRLSAAKLADEAAAKGDMQSALEHATEAVSVVAPARVVQASMAVATAASNIKYAQVASRKRWTFRIADIKKVPREYMEVNEKVVRAAISSGLRTISGIEIYEEEGLAVGGR